MATIGVAEPKLSPRTRLLRECVLRERAACEERDILFAQSFRETERELFREVRVATAVAHVLSHIRVRIRPGEVLAGWHPNGIPENVSCEELPNARSYLAGQRWFVPASEGHMAPDYETALTVGLGGLKTRLKKAAASLDHTAPDLPQKQIFYRSCEIALEGLQNFIKRYAHAARELAQDASDAAWQAELRQIAQTCDRIAVHPARTFREAIQLSWFIFLTVALENGQSHHCFGPGRMDQYLYPFYRAECRDGSLDEELVDDLLAQFFIKCNEFAGPQMSAVIMVVGGRKSDGSDATNELSYKMLEISNRVRGYFPGVDVSWHKDIDEAFMREAVKLLRNGKGQPAFFNSDVIVKGLTRLGIPFEHAVDHLPSTCTETSIMGRTNPWVAWPYMNVPMCLLYALFGGKHPLSGDTKACFLNRTSPEHMPRPDAPATPVPQSYDELISAFLVQLRYAAQEAMSIGIADQYVESIYRPFPLLSCLIRGCIESGRNISQGGALYNFLQPEIVGVTNVVDGLAAIRQLVALEGRYTLDDFHKAIQSDFEGYDELRRAIMRDCPKHGNDVDWVNELFDLVTGEWCSAIEGHKNFYGGPIFPGFLGWTIWIHFGENTPATPDGRRAGEPLANSLAPRAGVTVKGFPSVIFSTTGFDQSRGLGGITFNIRFNASALKEEKGVDALKGLIEGAFDLGCYQLQVNLASTEAMRDAQKEPDEYQDLFVRIGGYLVPFVLLPEKAQEEVIARTEMEL